MFPQMKKFNGDIFKRTSVFQKKRDAKKECKKLKRRGFNCRVVKDPRKNGQRGLLWRYAVYIKKRRRW